MKSVSKVVIQSPQQEEKHNSKIKQAFLGVNTRCKQIASFYTHWILQAISKKLQKLQIYSTCSTFRQYTFILNDFFPTVFTLPKFCYFFITTLGLQLSSWISALWPLKRQQIHRSFESLEQVYVLLLFISIFVTALLQPLMKVQQNNYY